MNIPEWAAKLTDIQGMALTLYGEARGQGLDGMLAVANVIMNRQRRSHQTILGICFRPLQFSCFNDDDPNVKLLRSIAGDWDTYFATNPVLRRCYWIAKGVIEKVLDSIVGSATNYHVASMKEKPYWTRDAKKMRYLCTVRDHMFYEEVLGR